MKKTYLRLICFATFFIIGCGENKLAESDIAQPGQLSPAARNEPKKAKAGAESNSPADAPPRDAQWTIVCKVIPGMGHVAQSKRLKDELITATKLSGWYVTHEEQQSTLYYGYYRSFDAKGDPKEAARLKADQLRVASLQDQIGNRPFKDALPVLINQPDPTAPPELNLVNAKGYWSLQIAAFEGPGRKEAAVESVREARKAGVEAYYHHGPNVSAVCVGAWPEEAIRKQEYDGGAQGDVVDPNSPLLVVGGNARLPRAVEDQYARDLVDRESGKKVQFLQEKVEVVDPTFRAAMTKFPNHSLNGYEDVAQEKDPRTGKMVTIHKPSMVVPIPHSSSILQHDIDATTPSLLNPTAPQQPFGGKLRSVGPG